MRRRALSAAAPRSAWSFGAHPTGVSAVRHARLAPGGSFYAEESLGHMLEELRFGAQRASVHSADYAVLELAEHDTTAAWVSDPANGAALAEPALWRALYELRCCATPVAAVLPDGALYAGPALLAPMVVARPGSLVVAGLPPPNQGGGSAAAVMPGSSPMLGRLGEGMGLYLAATGHALPAPEALHAGLVTHVLESHVSLRMLCDSLGALSEGRRFDHAVQTVDELAVQVRGNALFCTFTSEFLRMSS